MLYLAGFSLGGSLPLLTSHPASPPGITVFVWAARGSALLPLLFLFRSARGVLAVWLLVVAGGFAAGSLEAGSRETRRTAFAERPESVARPLVWQGSVTCRITGWPVSPSEDRWKVPARLLHRSSGTSGPGPCSPGIHDGVMLSGKGEAPYPGDIITGHADVFPPPRAILKGAFDYRMFLAGRNLQWQGRLTAWETISGEDPLARWGRTLFHPLRKGLVDRLDLNLPREESRMAAAVLLGIRDAESRRASRPFADLGLAHLFAVSGLHVGILLGIILLPGNVAGWSPWQKALPIFLLLPAYVLMTGMPGSVMRAASLGVLALLAGAVGRPAQTLRLLGLLFWAGTVWDPVQNLDMGLKLSYLAAGGILSVSSLTNGLKFSTNRILGPLGTGLSVSAAAQWFTLPLVAGSFGRISMLSPLANLIAVPLFGLAVWCVVLSLVLTDIWSFGAQSIASLAWLLFRGLAGLTGFVAGLSSGFPLGLPPPGIGRVGAWVLLSAAGLTALHLRETGRLGGHRVLVTVLMILGAGLAIFGPMSWSIRDGQKVRAWQFDVGQGDCCFLVFPDGWSLMIDTAGRYGFKASAEDGPVPRTVIPFLQRHGCSRIKAVVLTHGHLDHTGGAQALGRALQVDQWFVSGKADRSIRGVADSTRIVFPLAGQFLHRWKDWEVEVVYPPHALPEDTHENDTSLVVVLRKAGKDLAVWSGDLELEGEHLLLQSGYAPQDIQVWKAGHHGSNTSGSRELLDRFNPGLILLSAGVGNGYKHPNHGVYVVRGDTLAVARTDLQGTIMLEWDSDGLFHWETTLGTPLLIRHP